MNEPLPYPHGPKSSDSNARHFRMFEEAQIDNAFNAGNVRQLERRCSTALSDPFLPVLFRAKYEVYISMCPGRNPDHHLTNAEKMFDLIQQKIDEGEESEFARGMLEALKGSRDVIRASMVRVDLGTGGVVGDEGSNGGSGVGKVGNGAVNEKAPGQ